MSIRSIKFALLFLLTVAPVKLAAEGSTTAREIVSARTGILVDELSVIQAATADFPFSGRQAQVFKVADPAGEVYGVAIDERGVEVDPETLEEAELVAYRSLYGKFDEDLFDRVAGALPWEQIPVTFWLEVPEDDSVTRPEIDSTGEMMRVSGEQVDALYSQVDAARTATIATVTEPFLAQILGAGFDAELDEFAPTVYATLPVDQVPLYAAHPQVQWVSLDVDQSAQLAVTGLAMGATLLHAQGINAAGVRLAQVEVGGRVALANPFLGNVTQDQTNVCQENSNHSTAVAGILSSLHPTEQGIAHGAEIRAYGSCTGNSRQLRRRSRAAANWGARALNLSFGSDPNRRLGSFDRFYDDLVQNRWRTVVVSAGNNELGPLFCGDSSTGTGNVGSPAIAYNVISVGNYDAGFTPAWGDDVMNPCSSWRDPRSRNGDREKPEVAAPGTNILTPSSTFPWLGFFSGTSAAAPVVTGATGQLIQRSGILSVWPETVRALLMATAANDVGGDGPLGERDGAGGISVDRADQVLLGQAGGFGGVSYTCSSRRNRDLATLNLIAGVPARVVISWDTHPGFDGYRNRPSADLDLRILDPRGNQVVGSASFDNTYEIVEFTPATTGAYRLRVHKYRCSRNPKWLGWGWYQDPRPPVRRGMTWAKIDHAFVFGTDKFNCAGCNPYQGDTLCSEAHQVLCIRPDGSPNPGLPVNGNDGWLGGNVGLSPAVLGTNLLSLANANAICSNFFGPGWVMAEFHHPLGGWGWSSRGNVFAPNNTRLWVHINDQPANCWN